MTGHLVLTTLHTHNAASSIARLADMGVEPGLLASSVNCIVAQRLARRLCVHCREAYWPNPVELDELGVPDDQPEQIWIYRAVGCIQCSGTGYSGRVALYEVMELRGKLRKLVGSGSTDEIFAAALEQGMKTLRQDGIRLCLSGVSSLDEVRRVTGDRLA
jgi:type IV pilus assembly protein PilB